MSSTITIAHREDSTLEVTLRAPSEEEWGGWFDELRTSSHSAAYNLVAACAVKPSAAEVTAILREWPGLPEAAFAHLFVLAGAPIAADEGHEIDPERGENAEVIDLRMLIAAADAAEKSSAPLDAPWAGHVAAFAAAGVTFETIKDWLVRYPRPKQLWCLKTQHGILVFHRPDNRAILARESAKKSGELYASLKKFLLACLVHPSGPVFAEVCRQAPAIVSVVGADVDKMSGADAGVVVKK